MQDSMPGNKTLNTEEYTHPVVRWVLRHDNCLYFNILYIGLAVVLSIWLGLFWLVAVVSVHAILEFFRQYLMSRKFGFALLESLWELKLDMGLIIFAFWLSVYLDFIFGLAGLSAGARVVAQTGGRVAQAGTRAAAWQRIIRGVFITLDDVGLAFKALRRKKDKKQQGGNADESGLKLSWAQPYGTGDWFSILFLGVFFVLLFLAPLITGYDYPTVWSMISGEMKPFP